MYSFVIGGTLNYNLKAALRFFGVNTGSVDVHWDNNTIVKYNFPIMPYCKLLRKDVKSDFLSTIDRTSTNTKLRSLMSQSTYLIALLKYEAVLDNLYRKFFIFRLIVKNSWFLRELCFILCVVQIIMIMTYNRLDMEYTNRMLSKLSKPSS